MTPALEARFGPFVRALLGRGVLSFDGRRVRPESARIIAEGDADTAPILRLTGSVPTGSKAFTFSSGFDAGTFVLRLAVPGTDEPVRQWLKAGETSRPFPLDTRVVPESRGAVVRGYFVMGFRHILPDGIDHILFVLGLFLLSPRLKPLLVQVTAFTAAHTLSLALAALGFVSLPARVVEPLIALSIRPWYRRRIVVPGSLLIAAVGLFWFVQRIVSPA